MVLSAVEVETLQDRLFQLRCAAEDVATAVKDDADAAELASLTDELVSAAKSAEQLRN